MQKSFRSKIDWWLALIAVIGFAVPMVVLGLVGAEIPVPGLLVIFILVLPVMIIPVWIFFDTKYVFAENELRINSGPFRWKVPLAEITGIKPTRNPLSAPALSLDRLEITYSQGKQVLISPEDKTGFLEYLEKVRKVA